MIENQEKTSENKSFEVKRDEKGRILPGYTANPFGRPKGSLSLVALLKKELEREVEVANEKGEIERRKIAEILIRKIIKKAIQEEDIQMIKDILNRIDGMPKQTFGFDTEDMITEVEIKIIPPKNEGTTSNNNCISEGLRGVSEETKENNNS